MIITTTKLIKLYKYKYINRIAYRLILLLGADIWKEAKDSKFEKFIVEDGAVICSGAKVIGKKGILKIGKNSIIAANAVLLNSTGPNEIWGGGTS